MSYTKTIVCLANSRKAPRGRCVAGLEYVNGKLTSWVRPVSPRESQEINEHERHYRDGRDPDVLDIVEIPLLRPKPEPPQRENHEIDAGNYWVHRGRVGLDVVQSSIKPIALWTTDSSYSGINDRIPEEIGPQLPDSLRLVRPSDLVICVFVEGAEFDNARVRVRASFTWYSRRHLVSVTDPYWESAYQHQPEGEYLVGDAVMCISLGKPYKGYFYALAAAIITPERAR